MGAFTGLDDYVNRMTGGNSGAPENLMFCKKESYDGGTIIPIDSQHQWQTGWRSDGIPSAGAAAGAVATCDKTTTGALQFTNSAGGAAKRLVQAMLINGDLLSTGASQCLVADRLLACGGLSGTTTTAQTVGGSITRYTGGTGNQIWLEIQTQIGASVTSVTASYTNEAGTSGRTTAARVFGSTIYREIHTAIQLPLQAGDLGVQSVQSVTVLATTGTAGDFACVIYHPLAYLFGPCLPLGPLGSLGGLPEIVDDACIAFLFQQGTHNIDVVGTLCMVDV